VCYDRPVTGVGWCDWLIVLRLLRQLPLLQRSGLCLRCLSSLGDLCPEFLRTTLCSDRLFGFGLERGRPCRRGLHSLSFQLNVSTISETYLENSVFQRRKRSPAHVLPLVHFSAQPPEPFFVDDSANHSIHPMCHTELAHVKPRRGRVQASTSLPWPGTDA
jgi:hypothetical protein